MSAVHFNITSSPSDRKSSVGRPSSQRELLSSSPEAKEFEKRPRTSDASSDEGTLGYQSSQSVSTNSLHGLTRGSGVFKRATNAVFHEKSGLWTMPLSEVSTEAAVDMYLALQSNGLIFKRMDLQGEELRQYAEFHVRIAQAEPWNMCAVDDEGNVAGMCNFIRSAAAIDSSSLPHVAQEHWRIFLELEATFRRRGGVDTSDLLCCTFMGMLPQYQGLGLFGAMNTRQADVAAEHGYTSFWSWTLNPNVIKALGKGDGAIALASRLGNVFFAVPPWVSNQLIIPALAAAGLLPKGLQAFWVPLASLGIPLVEKAGGGLNPLVSANVLNSTAVQKRKKEVAGKAAAAARKKLIKLFMSLLALVMTLWSARTGRLQALLR